MGTALAEGLAAEFLRLIDEGWSPELDEFLGRVPEQHRDACRRRIEELQAPPAPAEPVRLSKEEARAMFSEMESAAAK